VADEGPGAASLADRIALGVLTRLVTRELVEDVFAVTGRAEQRKRLLPARVTVYFVLALALFYGDPYGIAATLAANVTHGLGHGPVGAAVAAWPAVALVGSYELLMMVIRGSQVLPDDVSGSTSIPGPLIGQAVEVFADQLAADRVPSIRAIRAQLHVGQPRAQRLRDYLPAGAVRQAERPAA
jgi:hypothetical protein